MRHGGRKKGTPNKKNESLMELARKLDVNPFQILLYFASNNYEALGYSPTTTKLTKQGPIEVMTISPELRKDAASDAAQYLYPKRKALELEGLESGEAIGIVLTKQVIQEAVAKDPFLKLEKKDESK